MRNGGKNPCYQCSKRELGCHATCESYKSWRKEKEELDKIIRERRALEGDRTMIHTGFSRRRKR